MDLIQQGVLCFLGYVINIFGGALVVEKILARLDKGKLQGGIKGAGRIIGMLERAFAITLVFAGQLNTIAIIFAAKSIIRFESSKDRAFAEYYLIGTMASLLFAALTGLAIVEVSAFWQRL